MTHSIENELTYLGAHFSYQFGEWGIAFDNEVVNAIWQASYAKYYCEYLKEDTQLVVDVVRTNEGTILRFLCLYDKAGKYYTLPNDETQETWLLKEVTNLSDAYDRYGYQIETPKNDEDEEVDEDEAFYNEEMNYIHMKEGTRCYRCKARYVYIYDEHPEYGVSCQCNRCYTD